MGSEAGGLAALDVRALGAPGALEAVEAWLTARLPGAGHLRVTSVDRPSSGFSSETMILSARFGSGGSPRSERFVLRKETPDPPVYPTQVPGLDTEVEIQFRVMAAVASTSAVPIAPLLGYEPSPSVLGAPFFVMGFVEGVVPIESPMYTLEGFFVDLTAPQRRTMVTDGLNRLAAIHAIDWRAADLDWLVAPGTIPGAAHQLMLWSAYSERELAGRHHPLLARALRWLEANLPEAAPPGEGVGLCWGDPRPGNMIWRDDRCVCVTDWEAASIAPAEVDLGWWLMFDRWAHETSGAVRLPGEPTRDEQRDLYERLAGRSVGDTTWYEVFAAARYTAIVVRVMNRSVQRGEMPADQTIWLDNPVVGCLADLLEEVGG